MNEININYSFMETTIFVCISIALATPVTQNMQVDPVDFQVRNQMSM